MKIEIEITDEHYKELVTYAEEAERPIEDKGASLLEWAIERYRG